MAVDGVFSFNVGDEAGVSAIIIFFINSPEQREALSHKAAEGALIYASNLFRQATLLNEAKILLETQKFLHALSHVVGQYQTPLEIAERAFPLIAEQIPARRMWLGTVNEQGTHITGQAGYGAGMRRRIIRVQVELDLVHDFFDAAVKNKEIQIVPAGTKLECSGLNRIVRALNPQTFLIIPLVSLGQLVGVFVIEPLNAKVTYAEEQKSLLERVGKQLASVILSRRLEEKSAEAEKMRMASLFASGIAHNFNNLLQAIIGQASLLELQFKDDVRATEAAGIISSAAARGAHLINQLMSYSSSTSYQQKKFDLLEVIKGSFDLYRSLVGPESFFDIKIDQGFKNLFCFADEALLQRAITNILVNAKEALSQKENGEVVLSLHKVRILSGEVDPSLAPGEYARIDISDNGPGMDSDRIARCFEPFFTTKQFDAATGVGYQGSGLGLSSAYTIIKEHGGIINIQSSPGRGATFSIYIPLIKAAVDSNRSFGNNSDGHVLLFGVKGIIGGTLSAALKENNIGATLEQDWERIEIFLAHQEKGRSVVVIDTEKDDKGLLSHLREYATKFSDAKFVLLTLDKGRWEHTLNTIQLPLQIHIVEKTLGVWSLLSEIIALLGLVKPSAASGDQNRGS